MSDCVSPADRGAEWLDSIAPGWHNHIYLDDLDIVNWRWCILGQLHMAGLLAWAVPPQPPGLEVDGYRYNGFLMSKEHDVGKLNQRWRELINERLANTSRPC